MTRVPLAASSTNSKTWPQPVLGNAAATEQRHVRTGLKPLRLCHHWLQWSLAAGHHGMIHRCRCHGPIQCVRKSRFLCSGFPHRSAPPGLHGCRAAHHRRGAHIRLSDCSGCKARFLECYTASETPVSLPSLRRRPPLHLLRHCPGHWLDFACR